MLRRWPRACRRLPCSRPMSSAATTDNCKKGYQAFGSFHSESADALFASSRTDPKQAEAPAFLPTIPSDQRLELGDKRGAKANAQLFALDLERWTYLNHGAFGGSTRFASQVAAAWRHKADQQPLSFHDRELFAHIVTSIRALAGLVNVKDPSELVLLHNATSGLHAVIDLVLCGQKSEDGERVVLCFSTRYGAVRKMIQAAEASGSAKVRLIEVPLSLEDSYDDAVVLSKLREALDREPNPVDLVVVDHVTSNTGVILPVKEIVDECHSRRASVLVDGAHALLNLDLNVDEIGADYYVGNCHKWFCSPRGAGFLHVSSERLSSARILPRIISHGYFDGYQSAFMWTGLQDYSAWLSLPKCIEFWQCQSIKNCRKYMHDLAQAAAEVLYERWGMLDDLAKVKRFPMHKRHAMRLVKLPQAHEVFGVNTGAPTTSADAKHIQDTLHEQFRIEVPIKCVDGVLYARISAHVYNTLADFEQLAHAVQQ